MINILKKLKKLKLVKNLIQKDGNLTYLDVNYVDGCLRVVELERISITNISMKMEMNMIGNPQQ